MLWQRFFSQIASDLAKDQFRFKIYFYALPIGPIFIMGSSFDECALGISILPILLS